MSMMEVSASAPNDKNIKERAEIYCISSVQLLEYKLRLSAKYKRKKPPYFQLYKLPINPIIE